MNIKGSKVRVYMDGKEIGEATNAITPSSDESQEPVRPPESRLSWTFTFKPDKDTEMFLTRPLRIKKYVKQILRQ